MEALTGIGKVDRKRIEKELDEKVKNTDWLFK